MLAANFIIKAFAWIFIAALDWVAYLILSIAYTIFVAVSELDIFSTEAGGTVYNEICARFYSAISVIMIFIFAYFLIMMIIDPDGGAKKASTQLVKDVVLSIVLVIVLPTIFGYMSLFQKHVLTNNTIGALILGGQGTIDDDPGKQISMIVFTAFFHPQGTMYSDYFNDDGTFIGKDKGLTVCKGPHDIGEKDSNGNPVEVSTKDDVCEAWVDGLESWTKSSSWGIGPISSKAKLRDTVSDEGGMEYIWVLSTVAAIAVAYFFFSYTLDIGTRAVKLGFLQIIAPAPVMLKMFPQTKKTFDTWFAEIKKCYLEIFFRVAVIFFIVKLCTMVPLFISAIFGSTSSVEGGFLVKAIATVCLILGLLKFAKEAPGLFKTIFSSSTGLFAGLDLKPGVKRRISENEYAMKGMSAVTGAVGGAIGAGAMAYRKNLKEGDGEGDADLAARFKAFGKGMMAAPRGMVSGGKAGFKNTPQEFGAKEMGGVFNSGASGAQSSYIHHENTKVFDFGKAGEAASEQDGFFNKGKTFFRTLFTQGKENGAQPFFEDIKTTLANERDLITGAASSGTAASGTIDKSSKFISELFNWTKGTAEPYKEARSALEKKVLTEGRAERDGVVITLNGGEDVGFDEGAYRTACGGKSMTYNRAAYEAECAADGKAVQETSTGHYYNPETKSYDASFVPDDFIRGRATTHKYNPNSHTYEDGYNPEDHYRKTAVKLADVKDDLTNSENEAIAAALRDKYKSGTATVMATLREQLSREIGNLGQETIDRMTAKINKGVPKENWISVDKFLQELSNTNHSISDKDVAALKGIKSVLEEQGRNISIQTQIQQQQQQSRRGGKQGGGDGGKKS